MTQSYAAQTDALIFDMDGTLWDAVETYARGFNDFFAANRIDRRFSKSDLAGYMGLEQAKYLEATIPEFSSEEREAIYEEVIELQYRRIQRDGGVLYEGVKDGLAKLSERYRIFIVSNCPEFTIEHFMRWAGIEALITDTMAHGKNKAPKYENIRHLVMKHDLKHPLYIGDTDSDRRQSELVPIPFVFVDYGFGRSDQYALRFSGFSELVRYFAP